MEKREKRNTQYTFNKDNLPRAFVNIAADKDSSIASADDTDENIGHSIFSKDTNLLLCNPHQLDEQMALLLRKAAQLINPFEQSFFLLIHLSYLQAFEDVNKRTARLACNISFIKENLCPLSFVDVPLDDYFKALLYFYEKNDWQPALELFQWAYLKSCEQYDVVKESLGEIDIFKIQYRALRKEAMGEVIRQRLTGAAIEGYLKGFVYKKRLSLLINLSR